MIQRALIMLLAACVCGNLSWAGTTVMNPPPTAGDNEGLAFGAVPDIQNYCSSWDPAADSVPPIADRADGIRQLRLLTSDIIAEKPEFLIQVGDIADTMGGADQSGVAGFLDDPNNFTSNFARFNGEAQCAYDNFFKPLFDAGIRVLWVAGNHDSCVDLERILPVSQFRTFSYYHSDQSRASRCSAAGLTDTMQRAALFTTSIGNICAVGGRYDGSENDATDIAYVNGAVGCGGTTPTILVNHNNGLGGFTSSTYGIAANSEVFMGLHGHTVPLGLVVTQSVASGGHQVTVAGLNWQESSRDCQSNPNPADPGKSMHTGVGFWVKFRLVPRRNELRVQARSAVFGGSHDVRAGCTYNNNPANGVFTFSPTICSRFASLKGC